jgi:hypothetical protein
MRLLLLSNNSFDPGIPFEDEVLVPEAANPKTSNNHLFSSKINTQPETQLEVKGFPRNPDPTEGKRDDSWKLSKFTIANRMPPFCTCIAIASTPEPSLTWIDLAISPNNLQTP